MGFSETHPEPRKILRKVTKWRSTKIMKCALRRFSETRAQNCRSRALTELLTQLKNLRGVAPAPQRSKGWCWIAPLAWLIINRTLKNKNKGSRRSATRSALVFILRPVMMPDTRRGQIQKNRPPSLIEKGDVLTAKNDRFLPQKRGSKNGLFLILIISVSIGGTKKAANPVGTRL